MFYSMENTMAILPQICLMVLGVCLLMTELRGERPEASHELIPDSRNKRFGIWNRRDFVLPPGEGLGYSVGENRFYIVRRDDELFRVYIARGSAPSNVVRRDQFGRYFMIRCSGIQDAVRMVRNIYLHERRHEGEVTETVRRRRR